MTALGIEVSACCNSCLQWTLLRRSRFVFDICVAQIYHGSKYGKGNVLIAGTTVKLENVLVKGWSYLHKCAIGDSGVLSVHLSFVRSPVCPPAVAKNRKSLDARGASKAVAPMQHHLYLHKRLGTY